jgi:DNA-directed RNA polymerase
VVTVNGRPTAPVEGLLDTSIKANEDYFTQFNTIIDKTVSTEIGTYLAAFKTDDNLDTLKFYFPGSDYYSADSSEILPQTLFQQEAAAFPALHNVQKWVESPVNETYPYPGADNQDTYIRGGLSNLEASTGELLNKTGELLKTYKFDSAAASVFKDYTIYG